MAQCSVYWYSAGCTFKVHPAPVHSVLIQWIVYCYSANCTGTLQSVFIHCRVYWCKEEYTGTVQGVLVHCRVYWFTAKCTVTVHSELVQCKAYWCSVDWTDTVQCAQVKCRVQSVLLQCRVYRSTFLGNKNCSLKIGFRIKKVFIKNFDHMSIVHLGSWNPYLVSPIQEKLITSLILCGYY